MKPRLEDLLRATSARLADVDADGRCLVESNVSGTLQCFELADGELAQLTDFSEPVTARYLGPTRQVVCSIDTGGNERGQLYIFDADDPPLADRSRLRPLVSDARYVHHLAGVRSDGGLVAFTSNRRNGVDFDAYVIDPVSGAERCVYDAGGWVQPSSGFSPDGRYLALGRIGERPLDHDLLLVELETGGVVRVLEHGEQSAAVGDPAWIDATSFFVSSSVDRDHKAVVRYDVTSGTSEPVLERSVDLEPYVSGDGSTLLVVANEDGSTVAKIYDAATLKEREVLPAPGEGVIDFSMACPPPRLAMDGSSVWFTFSSPVVPGDVFRFDCGAPGSVRLTTSPGAPDASLLARPERHRVASFDGEQIPLFCYRPPAGAADRSPAPPPVVVLVHGGPEGQSVLQFNPVIQGLVAKGYAVVVPNVRGSTGYGKRFASLDDTVRRLDSVADLRAVYGWLEGAGLDPLRAALWGGSYGGYMVLAGCAFQPELWAAGVDIVGISDLVTFLENTSAYRRRAREREYGALETDRAFLESASPLRHVEQMRAPLFVIHGKNDPRVPVSEAEQLVASLRQRQIPCELRIYPDEGHGLAKLANRLDAYPAAVAFLDRTLLEAR
jgi:acetyl esterase/lipase